MKDELKNIDKLFVNAWEESGDTPPVEGWDKMEKKLFINELKSFNFVNVKRKYRYISAVAIVIAAIFLFRLIQIDSGNQKSIVGIAIDTSGQATEEIPDSNIQKPNPQNPINTIIGSPTQTEESGKIVTGDQSTENEIFTNKEYTTTYMVKKESLTTRPALFINPLKSRHLQINLTAFSESCLVRTTVDQQNNKRTENHSLYEQIPVEPSSYYTLGVNLGSTWMIENNQQQEKINHPELFVGINLRYNTPGIFFETALNFSYFRSVYQTNYRYDTLLGKMIAPGYDIIEVVNSQGDTVLERQFHTEIISIYDTLSSQDQVGISSHVPPSYPFPFIWER